MIASPPPHTPRTEPGYHPPGFPLFEAAFDDAEAGVRRWLLGGNGLVTEPATDVTLAARRGGEAAVVTSSRWPDEVEARVAALQALTALSALPVFAGADALLAHAGADGRWAPADVEVDGEARRLTATTIAGVTAAYSWVGAAHFAVAGRRAVAVRSLDHAAGAAYPLSPFCSHSFDELHRVGTPSLG